MRCPYCSHPDTQVLETRDADEAVRRRRVCCSCETRFTTYERVDEIPLTVTKRDGRSQPFDRAKLLGGLIRATVKRPVTTEALETIADTVASEIRRSGGSLPAQQVGVLTLKHLRELDEVAYVRFASVYHNYRDVKEFASELASLGNVVKRSGSKSKKELLTVSSTKPKAQAAGRKPQKEKA